jgi:hypothetical protein
MARAIPRAELRLTIPASDLKRVIRVKHQLWGWMPRNDRESQRLVLH